MKDQLQMDFDAPRPARKRKAAEAALPCDPMERGHERHRAEQEAGLRELERRFGVVLNKRVRVTLREIPGEFEGKLFLDQLLHPSKRGEELRLRIGTVSFDACDVESCAVLEHPA